MDCNISKPWEIRVGDCISSMRVMPDASVDSVVTDPPYELGFMGKSWDASGIAFNTEVWKEALRVLKPGGHLLAFSGSRTYHRMVVAIEDSGFEVRDQIMWVYGSGFPKSHNLHGRWEGWGTALKPAHEPIVLARKPLIGTVAENVHQHGTGAINIDVCRVGSEVRFNAAAGNKAGGNSLNMSAIGMPVADGRLAIGRWPANLIHDGSEEVLEAFPQAPGQLMDASDDASARKTQNVYGAMRRGSQEPSRDDNNDGVVGFKMKPGARRLDEGSAARFFYCAKASRTDRNDGCEALPEHNGGMNSNTSGQHITRRDGWKPEPVKNNHPTVKPTELMRYLCRLVTPPGGLILDPFTGSGSTGRGAVLEGFRFLGLELSPEYVQIAEARITAAQSAALNPPKANKASRKKPAVSASNPLLPLETLSVTSLFLQ
jgi:DNA modification methylase